MKEGTVSAEFQRMGCSPVARTDKPNSLPAALVRCGCGQHALAGVESGVKNSLQVKLLAAAISWHLAGPNKNAPLRYIVGSADGGLTKVVAAFQLLAPFLETIPVEIRIGSQPIPAKPEPFPEKEEWIDALNSRAGLTVPEALGGLAEKESEFRWYRALTGKFWSGRLRGLEICTSDAAGRITFNVGQKGKGGRVSNLRAAFLRALDASDPVVIDIEKSRVIIARLRDDPEIEKGSSRSEHALEFQVLASKIPITIDGVALSPVGEVPCQLPAQWWPDDPKRHIDALMKNGSVPWVAELKVPSGGQGRYYREGIVQAALYRGFIRAADWLDGWFRDNGLERSRCAAVVVIPELRGGKEYEERLRQELGDLARVFDVRLVEVRWPP